MSIQQKCINCMVNTEYGIPMAMMHHHQKNEVLSFVIRQAQKMYTLQLLIAASAAACHLLSVVPVIIIIEDCDFLLT